MRNSRSSLSPSLLFVVRELLKSPRPAQSRISLRSVFHSSSTSVQRLSDRLHKAAHRRCWWNQAEESQRHRHPDSRHPHSDKLRTRGAPDRRSGALFERLEIASFGHRFSSRDKTRLVIARQAIASEFLVCHVAAEICQDSARMNGEGANSNGFATPISSTANSTFAVFDWP